MIDEIYSRSSATILIPEVNLSNYIHQIRLTHLARDRLASPIQAQTTMPSRMNLHTAWYTYTLTMQTKAIGEHL
jgi:hypothetical protein